MSGLYAQIHVHVDPEYLDPLPGGGPLRDVRVILSDHPDQEAPAEIAFLPHTARQVAGELLIAANTADLLMEGARDERHDAASAAA